MSDAAYRTIFIGLGLAFVGVVVGAVMYGSPSAPESVLPEVLEEISPIAGSQVPLQAPIEVDVPVGYRIEMFVDDFRVPASEIRFVEGTGVYSFSPFQSTVIGWGAGPHTVTVTWSRIGGLPDVGTHTWTFRVF